MNAKDQAEDSRPSAYPKPTQTDVQLQNQPEYIDQEPNTYDKEISDVPDDSISKNPGNNQ